MKKPVVLICVLFFLVTGLLLYRFIPLISKKYFPSLPQKLPSYALGLYARGHWYQGESVRLEDDGTYTWTSHSDVEQENATSPPHDYVHQFQVEDNRVTFREDESTYYWVPWGKRAYLITDSEFVAFVKAIRTGQEPCMPMRNNSFLVRGDKIDGIPKGLPQFPKQWQHLLRDVKPAELGVPPGEHYLSRVMRVANKACKEGSDKKAVLYAKEVMKRGPSANSDDYSHDVYMIFGWAELRAGRISSAKEYLSKASKKLPHQSSSPYKEFLQGLCLKGERQAALGYVDARIKELSEPERTKLWRQQVMENRIPKLFKPEDEHGRE